MRKWVRPKAAVCVQPRCAHHALIHMGSADSRKRTETCGQQICWGGGVQKGKAMCKIKEEKNKKTFINKDYMKNMQ